MKKIAKKGKENFQKFISTKNHKYKKTKMKYLKFKNETHQTVFLIKA